MLDIGPWKDAKFVVYTLTLSSRPSTKSQSSYFASRSTKDHARSCRKDVPIDQNRRASSQHWSISLSLQWKLTTSKSNSKTEIDSADNNRKRKIDFIEELVSPHQSSKKNKVVKEDDFIEEEEFHKIFEFEIVKHLSESFYTSDILRHIQRSASFSGVPIIWREKEDDMLYTKRLIAETEVIIKKNDE